MSVVDAAAAASTETPWRRLSRRMLLVHPVHEVLRLLPIILALLVFGRGDTGAIGYGLLAAAAAVTIGVIRWMTTEYRVTPEQVQIRKGVLQRSVSSVARDRVRAVDVTSRVMHRLLGLAVITIGTGRNDASNDAALRLDGLTVEETARLRAELLHRADADLDADGHAVAQPPGEVLTRWRNAWVRYGPFSFSGFVTLGVLAGAAAQAMGSMVDINVDTDGSGLETALSDLPLVPLLVLVAAVIVLAAIVLSTAGYLVAHWRFTLTREPTGTLHVTRGLLTTRATTLEERRLRGVELNDPLPLRLARGARVTAIATGGDARGSAGLLPPAPRDEALRTATLVLGDEAPLTAPLHDHGPAARRRRYTRALAPAAAVAALGLIAVAADVLAVGLWGAAAAALLTCAALLGADRARSLGHARVGPWLVTRSGTLTRTRAVLECDGVIGVTFRASFFQRRAGLCTLTATTAGGREGYDVLDVDPAVAVALADDAVPGLLAPFRLRSAK